MAENSAIEWTHHTVNFWWGCAKVSPACAHCYAEGQAARFYPGLWGPEGDRRVRLEAACREAFRYERQAVKEGRRLRVFTNSMADFFEDRRDLDQVRLEALEVIRQTPHLDWLILTKRSEAILGLLARVQGIALEGAPIDRNPALAEYLGWWLCGKPPANVWLGTTVEDQERADRRIPALLRVPAAVRFVSMEPLLGPVNLCGLGLHKGWCPTHDFPGGFCHGPCPDDRRLDWVICGGESGPKARPMHPDWARGLRDQCAAAGVPFLFKQWGEWAPDCLCLRPAICPEVKRPEPGKPGCMFRCGKKAAGRLLDGQMHDAYPEVAHG